MDNSSAFPTDIEKQGLNGGITYEKAQTGLTKREWFAGMALIGICLNTKDIVELDKEPYPKIVSKMAYQLSDAMLAAGKGEG